MCVRAGLDCSAKAALTLVEQALGGTNPSTLPAGGACLNKRCTALLRMAADVALGFGFTLTDVSMAPPPLSPSLRPLVHTQSVRFPCVSFASFGGVVHSKKYCANTLGNDSTAWARPDCNSCLSYANVVNGSRQDNGSWWHDFGSTF